jgi:hypothetical protein
MVAHHHWCCEFESRSGRGVQHYVITFVSVFSAGTHVSSTNKTHRHDIAEILLKVALNTMKPTLTYYLLFVMKEICPITCDVAVIFYQLSSAVDYLNYKLSLE